MKQLFAFILLISALPLSAQQPVYQDIPYWQDISVKHYLPDTANRLKAVFRDRNGVIQVLSEKGLLRPQGGQFQYPGTLLPERAYIPMRDRHLAAMTLVQHQFVYLDDVAVLSNAWAGKLYQNHDLPQARLFAGGQPGSWLVSDGKRLKLLKEGQTDWTGQLPDDDVQAIRYDAVRNRFWLLGSQSVSYLSVADKQLKTVLRQPDLTCFDLTDNTLYIGTRNGYLTVDAVQGKPTGPLQTRLPCPDISAIAYVHGNLWFGSPMGAFMRRSDGKFNYYFGERWLPGNQVVHIAAGEGRNVLILTTKGLGEVQFKPMTLQDKALVYEQQVRQRHIRYGFNCDVVTLKHGDLSTFEMGQRDSDNLWTSMYLVSQLYRYKVTGDPEALQNCMESFDAMERLFTITDMPGFFARGFERKGYHKFKAEAWDGGLTNGWTVAKDPEWNWRGTTSSDQTVGQFFALTQLAEIMDGDVRKRAITLMDKLMTNIINNDWYLLDVDGKPTLWGKWNPAYVNSFDIIVGDRKIMSSNLIAFLQAAYHFTKKPVYKEKAMEMMHKYGYLDNLMRPMKSIGPAPANAGELAASLSEEWNHSDDEMYFLAYHSLYAYAFDAGLKTKFREAIRDHWDIERPERDGLWNLCYAATGAKTFDLPETVWYLKEFPLDMVEWQVKNSHRKDLTFVPANFRGQTTTEVLPPDERPELKHNRNQFKLDRNENGVSELSAGDSFLLPYWMGRYLGVISGPKK